MNNCYLCSSSKMCLQCNDYQYYLDISNQCQCLYIYIYIYILIYILFIIDIISYIIDCNKSLINC